MRIEAFPRIHDPLDLLAIVGPIYIHANERSLALDLFHVRVALNCSHFQHLMEEIACRSIVGQCAWVQSETSLQCSLARSALNERGSGTPQCRLDGK